MNVEQHISEPEVLIVGGGPAGITTALCLAARGVASLVIERNSAISEHPKAHELNTRSIEILNGLGITTEELAQEASPDSDGSRILFCKSINEEFGRIDLLSEDGSAQKYKRHFRSARPYLNLSQVEFEKVLARHAGQSPLIEILFDQEWLSFDDAEGTETSTTETTSASAKLISVVQDRRSGEKRRLASRYVIAADGAASPTRKALGIQMKGPAQLQDFINVYFEHNLRPSVTTPAKLYWILNPAAPGAFIAHHMEKRWTYNMPLATPYESREDYPEEILKERIETALGFDAGIEIRSVSYWRMTVQIAERYRAGSVFLVGDSAHRFPPTGGLGMNTGIADAHNLAWKIATVLRSGASERLLDSYELERKPVAERNAEESRANFDKIFEVIEAFGLPRNGLALTARMAKSPLIRFLPKFLKRRLLDLVRLPAHRMLDRFYRSPDVKERVLDAIADQLGHFDRIGLDIGYVYQEGAIVGDRCAGERAGRYSVTEYTPSTEPGARFPHVSLNPSSEGGEAATSSHDLIAYDQFTLLVGPQATGWRQAALQLESATGFEVRVLSIAELEASPRGVHELESLCRLGSSGALLLRPDGHVAWRSDSQPSSPEAELRAVAESLGLVGSSTASIAS